MRDNVRQFVHMLCEGLDAPTPVVEVGALQVEGQTEYADMRPFFGDHAYVGGDMLPGPGVDCLIDGHRLPFGAETAGTVLLLDTLEHVLDPITVLSEAERVVRPGGVVVATSHMNFPIHAYPSDYWRFTPMAFDYLLRSFHPRFVYTQGDGEAPHTVIGVGMLRGEAAEAQRLLEAVQAVDTGWPDDVYGGALVRWQPSFIALAQRDGERRLPALVAGRTIRQRFTCPSDNLARIDVRMSNLGRVNYCQVLFRLLEEDEREVAAYRLFGFHVVDGAWTTIPIPVQSSSRGRTYVLSIESPDGTEDQAVAACASAGDGYAEGELLVNDEPQAGSLCFNVYCLSSDDVAEPETRDAAGGAVVAAAARPAPPPDRLGDLILRAEERSWEQTRHLAAVLRSGFAGLQASLKELERVQSEALEESQEAASLARAVKQNPLARLWKRLGRLGR